MEFPSEELEILTPESEILSDTEYLSETEAYYLKEAIKIVGQDADRLMIISLSMKLMRENQERKSVCFEEHRKFILELNKDFIQKKMDQIVEPFKPFVNPVVCCTSEIVFVFDEDKYRASASSGLVPTMTSESDALKYLEERKKTDCCGSHCTKHPRLF